MFKTAIVHKEVLQESIKHCRLVYRPNMVWPLSEYVPRGPGRGILVTKSDTYRAPSSLTIGVFEVSNDNYELVWKELTGNSELSSRIGVNGAYLKQSIALDEIDRLQKIYGFKMAVRLSKDGSVRITIQLKG